jgi:hypothetical protein
MENSKRVFKNTLGKNIHYGVMDILHLLSTLLAKEQPKITYGTGSKLTLMIHWG